jgi:hypothetical protein
MLCATPPGANLGRGDRFHQLSPSVLRLLSIIFCRLKGASGTTTTTLEVRVHAGETVKGPRSAFDGQIILMHEGLWYIVFIDKLLRVDGSSVIFFDTIKHEGDMLANEEKGHDGALRPLLMNNINLLRDSFRHSPDPRGLGLLHTSKETREDHDSKYQRVLVGKRNEQDGTTSAARSVQLLLSSRSFSCRCGVGCSLCQCRTVV